MKALIVDDDRTLADLLAFTLRRAGFEPHLAFDAPGAMKVFEGTAFDVIILDVNMPGRPGLRNGFDVCRKIREQSDVPIILLTVRDDEEDIVKGLNDGADDYVLKPFSPRQLLARVQSVVRRSSAARVHHDAPFTFQDVVFDPNRREFSREGRPTQQLTPLESSLIEYLLLNAGQVIPTDNLIAQVWGSGGGSTEMLRQLVRRLRLKVEDDPNAPELIKTLPGVGYGFGL